MTLREFDLSIAAAARSLDISRQHLFKVVYGEIAISPEMAIRLEKGLGVDAHEWLRIQAAYDLSQINADHLSVKPLDCSPLRQPKRLFRSKLIDKTP